MAKDIIHDAVKNALIKDGWVITHDPYPLEYKGIALRGDCEMDKLNRYRILIKQLLTDYAQLLKQAPYSDLETELILGSANK